MRRPTKAPNTGSPRAAKPAAAPTPRPAARESIRLPDVAPLAPPESFASAAAALGIEFDAGDVERLGLYLAMLLEANKQVNLTAVDDPAGAWTRHILDSLTLLPMLAELPDGARVIDVGTGGGLPGIPLAITLPHLRFTLLEATGKKVDFLKECVKRLKLTNTEVVQGRAETVGHDRGERVSSGGIASRKGGHRELYDAVVSRAVGRLNVLLELTVPFARAVNADDADARAPGLVLLIKGQKADEELAEAAEALHLLKAVHTLTVDTPTGRIVVIEKRSATPRMYPRRDGEPARVPLGRK